MRHSVPRVGSQVQKDRLKLGLIGQQCGQPGVGLYPNRDPRPERVIEQIAQLIQYPLRIHRFVDEDVTTGEGQQTAADRASPLDSRAKRAPAVLLPLGLPAAPRSAPHCRRSPAGGC